MTLLTEFFRDLRFGARLLRRSAGLHVDRGAVARARHRRRDRRVLARQCHRPAHAAGAGSAAALSRRDAVSPGREFGDIFSAPAFEHARDELSSRGAGELFAATERGRHAAAGRRRSDRRARQRAAGVGRVLHGAAPAGAGRAAARRRPTTAPSARIRSPSSATASGAGTSAPRPTPSAGRSPSTAPPSPSSASRARASSARRWRCARPTRGSRT